MKDECEKNLSVLVTKTPSYRYIYRRTYTIIYLLKR